MTEKHPRVKPDGKVVLVNKGTATNPDVHVVPTAKQIEEGTNLNDFVVDGSLKFTTPSEADTMKAFARSLGVAAEDVDSFVAQWAEATERILQAPKQELLYRLNCRVQGIDPGLPTNWPGERGLR